MSFGTSCGWPSFSFLILESEDTPLKSGRLTMEELSWIVSIFCFGGVFGNFLFGWLIDKVSRKQILYAVAVPQIVSLNCIANLIVICNSTAFSLVGF